MIIKEGKILFKVCRAAIDQLSINVVQNSDRAIIVWYDTLKDSDYFSSLKPWQIVNRIPAINYICRKAPLIRLMQRMQTAFPRYYDFIPESYILPIEKDSFKIEVSKHLNKYILKPDNGSLGYGIRVYDRFTNFSSFVIPKNLVVAQKYIDSYLINSTKFDLRVYVLIKSVSPLSIYVYRDGLARFCSKKSRFGDIYSQLTNTAINKKNMSPKDISNITKTISSTFAIIKEEGGNITKIWNQIDNISILTILSNYRIMEEAESKRCPPNKCFKSRCFQLLGFDIILDKDLKAYLLEVNYRPSLEFDTLEERNLKTTLISDILKITSYDPMMQYVISKEQKLTTESFNLIAENHQFNPSPGSQFYKTTRFKQVYPSRSKNNQRIYEKIKLKVEQMSPKIYSRTQLPVPYIPLINEQNTPQNPGNVVPSVSHVYQKSDNNIEKTKGQNQATNRSQNFQGQSSQNRSKSVPFISNPTIPKAPNQNIASKAGLVNEDVGSRSISILKTPNVDTRSTTIIKNDDISCRSQGNKQNKTNKSTGYTTQTNDTKFNKSNKSSALDRNQETLTTDKKEQLPNTIKQSEKSSYLENSVDLRPASIIRHRLSRSPERPLKPPGERIDVHQKYQLEMIDINSIERSSSKPISARKSPRREEISNPSKLGYAKARFEQLDNNKNMTTMKHKANCPTNIKPKKDNNIRSRGRTSIEIHPT